MDKVMHKLLKYQLKKSSIDRNSAVSIEQMQSFTKQINQTYIDNEAESELLEHALKISSTEMHKLYSKLTLSEQNKLRVSEGKFQRLVENLHDHYFFYIHNKEGVFTYISESMTGMLGYSVTEFLTHYKSYMTDDPINKYVNDYTELAMQGKEQPPYKVSIYHKNGSVVILEVSEHPIYDTDGQVIEIGGIAKDITQNIKIQNDLDFIAQHDILTGLANRMNLHNQMKLIISEAKRQQSKFALLFIDLDHFKHINDTLGHDVGDQVLQLIADRIKPDIRDKDVFARIGGDEFVMVLTDISRVYLVSVIDKVMRLLRKKCVINDYTVNVSSSIGIAIYPDDGLDMACLMKNADLAMYKAKEMGRDQFHFFCDDLNKDVQEEISLEKDLQQALENNEFILYFQPKLETATNRLIGAEALLRWQHPRKGLLSPESFLSLTENTGFIIKLGQWVIQEACRAIARFNKVGKEPLQLSINISTGQLQHDQLYNMINHALQINDISPELLFIEVHETIMLNKSKKIIHTLHQLHDLGVGICIEDFGIGHSSFTCLHDFFINRLKIDKSFVAQINNNQVALLDTIIAMARALNMELIAEGVEHESQRSYLIAKDCLMYQGYLFSKPVDEQTYIKLISLPPDS